MLSGNLNKNRIEAGCDEAGRGCLAGPVVAAAVILPQGYKNKFLNDSKKLSRNDRQKLKLEIENDALSYGIAHCSVREIERLNILKASIFAMHRAVKKLKIVPEFLLIDGNRFIPFPGISHQCIIKGDEKFMSIAAASILAKTFRDEMMEKLNHQFPMYSWNKNMGYPTRLHREMIQLHGACVHHRKTFQLLSRQSQIEFNN